MYDFIFHNPTKVIFGSGREEEIGGELKSAGVASVLLVYGKESVRKSGLLDRVIASLNQNGISFIEFGGVVSNPVLSHTREGIALARRQSVDGVLAVGGGSVLDEGKAIAVGVVSEGDIWEYFLGREVTKALPVFTILTLAATGSEMNGNAVITNEETQQKYNIGGIHTYPRLSILNPELTHTVSPDYSAYGAVDAIAHLIEAYFTKKPGTVLQDRMVEGLILTIIEDAGSIKIDPSDSTARASMMWAATLALNGLTPAGVGNYTFPNHMIEHSLSAIYNIAHGAGLSIVIPAWMRWYKPRNESQFERFASEIFDLSFADEGVEALTALFRELGCPTSLKEVGIPAGDIEKIAENAYTLAKKWRIDAIYTREVIEEILQLAAN